MVFSFFYVILAILGLSFLIFIHELGHYYAARRAGMSVETFSIGFGKPLYRWKKDGVTWQIGWLLFGGYVKIAGMDVSQKEDALDVQGGFYSKPPLERIKVAIAGPLINIAFAFVVFVFLWSAGGRKKQFNEYTHKIGWLDPKSELYQKGVRPGDEIISYNEVPFHSSKDHLYAPMLAGQQLLVKGNKTIPQTLEKVPFSYLISPYNYPTGTEKELLTSGVLAPASYLIYDKLPNGAENPLPENSPLKESGIQYGDRIVWVDGELIYSVPQLNHILNDSKVLLTVKQGGAIFLRRAPRVMSEELKLDPLFKEELADWQYAAHLNSIKLQNLYTIPYNLTNQGVVENPLRFIDKEKQEESFVARPYSSTDFPLQPGDQIIAVDGVAVTTAAEILAQIQHHRVSIIVERDGGFNRSLPEQTADFIFDRRIKWDDLQGVATQIGSSKGSKGINNLALLKPVEPKPLSKLLSDAQKQQLAPSGLKMDPLILGIPAPQDQSIQYNPNPIALFDDVVGEIWRTLQALFSGTLNPKWMSGPIGIVQVVQHQSMMGFKEALYWLGLISLNLGVLNLLPIPVLDGGTIVFCLYEMLTGHRIKPKTMEKLIVPFAILLMLFFLFVTYHDIMRIITGFLR